MYIMYFFQFFFIWNPNVYFSLQVKFNTAHASQFIQIKEFKSKLTLQSQIVQLELPIQNAIYINEYDFWDIYCKPTFIHRREILRGLREPRYCEYF